MKINDLMIKRALYGSLDDREKIIELLEPLIKASISKYYYRAHLYDDLVQDGRVQILHCFDTFDSTKGVHFLGYVKTMLRYYYLNRNRDMEHYSLDQTNEEGLSQMELLESEEDIEADFLESERNKKLNDALEQLTEIERSIVIDFYYKELSLNEIAELRSISYRTAVNNKTRAINKLRRFLEE